MNILLYAPELAGHPQVYCRVITDVLLKNGCNVVLAVGLAAERGESSADIEVIAGDGKVEIVDCRQYSESGRCDLTVEEIRNIQQRYAIDATLFIEADKSRADLLRIGEGHAPRLLGRNVGIFARTSAWYPSEEFYSGARIKWYGPSLRNTLGKLKRAVFSKKQSDKHFYEKVILKKRALDAILVKDERVTERFGPPVYWLPEIYKPFDHFQSADEEKEYDLFAPGYLSYLSRQSGREVLLFFGRGAWYRGYDFFLKLLDMDPSLCGVHCGAEYLQEAGKAYEFDIAGLRRQLAAAGRLFETRQYIESRKLIALFFSTSARSVSTHRLTGSSGTMLQALDAGKPVLVPGSGLLGYRVRQHAIGETYRYSDMADLFHRWQAFKKRPAGDYSDAIARFMQKFSQEALSRCLQKAILKEG